MLFCYFIAQSRPELEHGPYRTLEGAPLCFVRHEDLVAAARPWPPGARLAPELMLEYNAVLAAACKLATVLPLRVGTRFRDEAALRVLMAGRRRELLAALERLKDTTEMGLQAPLADQESAYQKAAELARLAQPLDARFQIRSRPAGGTFLEVAHLITRREVEAYRERLKAQGWESTGPRPPFHFLPEFLRLPVRAEQRPRRARRASASQS